MKEIFEIERNEDRDEVSIKMLINDIEVAYAFLVIIDYPSYHLFKDELSVDEYIDIINDDDFIMIETLKVMDTHRKKGYATKLMFYILDWVKSLGINKIYLNASPMGNHIDLDSLVSFYKKFGFKEIVSKYDNNKEMLLTMEMVNIDIEIEDDITDDIESDVEDDIDTEYPRIIKRYSDFIELSMSKYNSLTFPTNYP